MYSYQTTGTCSSLITFDVDDNNRLHNVQFLGGCNGNLQGISRLVEDMDVDQAIARLEGIRCNGGPTSCPDQLAQALNQYKIKTGRLA